MIATNILRALPCNILNDPAAEQDDDEPFYEPAWPHLQLVYELLRAFVICGEMDSASLREVLSVPFVVGVVELFNSEDPREREYLKTILHRIYAKVMPLRAPIRKAMLDTFQAVVFENRRCHGVCELLEILGSIIHGFAIPVKEEHRNMFRKGILPLHLPASMPAYHVQLAFCVAQFVEKAPELSPEVLSSVLRHWPVRNTRKEVMLLAELEESLELGGDHCTDMLQTLFRRLGRSIASPHFQVAERALFYWNNDHVMQVFTRHKDILMPTVVWALMKNTSTHWNRNVSLLSRNVLDSVRGVDADLFHKCCVAYEHECKDAGRQEHERMMRWSKVYRMAQLQRGCKQRARMVQARDDANIDDVGATEAETDSAEEAMVECVNVNGGEVMHSGVYMDELRSSVLSRSPEVVEGGE